MSTIKSHTDLPQSKVLSGILPRESADMAYLYWRNFEKQEGIDTPPTILDGLPIDSCDIPCWSLSALLGVLSISINTLRGGKWNAMVCHDGEMIYEVKDNPIDACYELILKLHGLKKL